MTQEIVILRNGGKMNEELYWFWFANIPGIGTRKGKILLQYFHTPEQIFYAKEKELCEIDGITVRDAKYICKAERKDLKGKYMNLKKRGIEFVPLVSNEYPNRLKQIDDPPLAIYAMGHLPPEDKQSIAIVGARNCSYYGKEMAEYFAGVLAESGFSIISGMAKGIDGFAHWGAMRKNKETYAVLGTGVDICYPKCHTLLYQHIIQTGGIISEFLPGTTAAPWHFPMRNRIISALSDGILLVEARRKSGSLITVDAGLEQGKDIFAVPGRIGDEKSEGCNEMIRMGGNLVNSPQQIVEYYSLLFSSSNKNHEKVNIFLETTEKIVYANLRCEPKHMDEIATQSGLTGTEVLKALISLENKSLCEEVMQNYYIRKVI